MYINPERIGSLFGSAVYVFVDLKHIENDRARDKIYISWFLVYRSEKVYKVKEGKKNVIDRKPETIRYRKKEKQVRYGKNATLEFVTQFRSVTTIRSRVSTYTNRLWPLSSLYLLLQWQIVVIHLKQRKKKCLTLSL